MLDMWMPALAPRTAPTADDETLPMSQNDAEPDEDMTTEPDEEGELDTGFDTWQSEAECMDNQDRYDDDPNPYHGTYSEE